MVTPVSQAFTTDIATNSQTAVFGDNLDSFLTILTTQLENQDPLSPMDATQFTQQLVQFSSIEQSILTNQKLERLLAMTRASETSSALNYVGKTVEVDGSRVLSSRELGANIAYEIAAPAASQTVRILDARGQLVDEIEAGPAGTAGRQTVYWDARSASGATAPDGVYTVTVRATDAAGRSVNVSTTYETTIEAVEFDDDGIVLVGPDGRIPFESVRRLTDSGDGDAAADDGTTPAAVRAAIAG